MAGATITLTNSGELVNIPSTAFTHIASGGIDYKGTVENLHDTMKGLSNAELITALNGDTVTMTKQMTVVVVDTSVSSATITLVSTLTGQGFLVLPIGAGLLYVKGNGVYLGASGLGTPISQGLSFKGFCYANTLYPVNEVAADYSSGLQRVEVYSKGIMRNIGSHSGGTINSIPFMVPFSPTNYTRPVLGIDGPGIAITNTTNVSETSMGFIKNSSHLTTWVRGGKY